MKRYRGRRSSAWLPGVLGLLLGACLLAPAPASALLTHPFIETFGAANQPAFTEAQGLAVDQATGDLLVIDAGKRGAGEGTISRFHSNGTPSNFSALTTNVIDGHAGEADETPQEGLRFTFPREVQVAVDNSGGETDGNIYVTQVDKHVIDVFGEDGSYLEQLTASSEGPFGEVCGVGVDPSGNVYVGDYTASKVHKFVPSGVSPVNADNTANFPFKHVCTLAAGAGPTASFIFPARIEDSASAAAKLDSTSGEEKYEVDPGPIRTETVDPATGHLFLAFENEVREYDVSSTGGPTLLTKIVSAGGERVTGIAVDKTTGSVYVARKGNPNVEVWGPSVILPDAITEAATVANGSITLHGRVSADGGPPASCAFEYVEGHAKGFQGAGSVPCSPSGPFTGSSTEAVSAEIKGLPEAGYRFRLVATNENGSSRGETLFFNNVEEPGLPDGRAYEMVSPQQKAGEVIPPEPGGLLGGTCFECLPGNNNELRPMQSAPDGESILYLGQPFSGGLFSGPNEYLAMRSSNGWGTQSISPPNITGSYEAFSPDLSRAVLSQAEPVLSPQAPTRGGQGFANLYLREDGEFQPLVTEEPPHRDPGLHQQFGNQFQLTFSGANAGTSSAPAFGHLIFEANDALTEGVPGVAPPAPEADSGEFCAFSGANCDLYEWAGGQLHLINVLPGNASAAANSVIGSGRLLSSDGGQGPNVDHAISADGSHVFWSTEETGQVYVRIDGTETLEVSGPGSCKWSVFQAQDRGCFLTASADGSAVLLSDGKIYEPDEAGDAYVETVDLTKGHGGFKGILGAAEDLSRVYFVDTAELTGENAEHRSPVAGGFNLYAWDDGQFTFVGGLAAIDNAAGRYGSWKFSISTRTAQVSADGGYLAFTSVEPLTGYDNTLRGGGNCGTLTGPPCSEAFEYSAASKSLICASCNPSGEQPLGFSNFSLIKPGIENGGTIFPPFPQPGNLSADGSGRLFFESQDTLSPRDLNGRVQDVYEWEPNGVGGCNRANGCVSLISSGTSPNESMFLDSTPSGNDAFFITRSQLLLRDRDEQLDVYDARVNGGIAENPPRPCDSGESCLGALSTAPEQPGAGSSTFAGPGNEKQKPKKHKKHRKHKSHKRAAKTTEGGHK